MRFLLFDAPGKPAEFIQSALQTVVCPVQPGAVYQGSRLPPAPGGTTGDG